MQDELEEVLVQKENYINEDPDSPDYDSDYEQSELWGNRESEIVDELEELEGADQPESEQVIITDPAITEGEEDAVERYFGADAKVN